MNVTIANLQSFADAWNRHDAEALMGFMTDDCVFEASAGPEVCGTRYVGSEAVQAGFSDVWKAYPDAQWHAARHFVCVDRGVSEWTASGGIVTAVSHSRGPPSAARADRRHRPVSRDRRDRPHPLFAPPAVA